MIEVNMDIKEEIIYPEDTVQIFMEEEKDIKKENVFFKEEFDERDIKQENNLFVKQEFEDGQILGTESFTNEEDLSEVKDNASISTLGTSFNKKEKMTCLGCYRKFVCLKRHFAGTIGTTCKQKYLENLDNLNGAFVPVPRATKRKTIFLLKKSRHNPKNANNYEEAEFVFCKGCSKPFQNILSHLNRENGKSCREFYGAEELQPPSKQNRYKENYQKNKEARKEQMKENYQKNREARLKRMKETYQKNRESRKNQMKENYVKKKLLTLETIDVIKEDDNDDEIDKDNGEDDSDDEENLFANEDVSVETYQKNREARKKQMKENYQKNKVVRKQKMKENIKRKLLIMNTIDDMKEDDNDDELYKDSGEDDEEDVFAKEDVSVAFGNQIQGMPYEEADKGNH